MSTGLTRQYYTRGGQGTFVYAPDIAVFIHTQENGIIDLSPKIVDFSLDRVVNNVSGFNCTFDNKYGLYDRRIRRMDRIVVFLKRISWVQVFSGYVTEAPWQTVVPGNATLRAECTLKRLKHSYFDPHSLEGQELFPFMNSATDWQATDGGAAATLVRLLTQVALWDEDKIQIQKIPKPWITRAVKLAIKLANAESEFQDTTAYLSILQAFNNLVDAAGWQGYLNNLTNWADQANRRVGSQQGAGVGLYSDAQWKEYVGKLDIPINPPNSGNVALTGGYIHEEHPESLFSVQVSGSTVSQKISTNALGTTLYLRMDAADALAKLLYTFKNETQNNWDIEFGYLNWAQAKAQYKNNNGIILTPVNDSDFVWGTAIKVTPNSPLYKWLNDSKPEKHVRWGWHKLYDPNEIETNIENKEKYINQLIPSTAFVFRGSPKYWDAIGRPDGTLQSDQNWDGIKTSALKNLEPGEGPNEAFSDASVFSFSFFYPGVDQESDILIGNRAWVNDVPVLDYIQQTCGASQRDFMSAPNGDFVAFFPDRLGQYSNFPALRVRDIEVVDFKAVVNDDSLVTHYISYGDYDVPTGATGHTIFMDVFLTSAMVTLDQPDVIKFLLGLPDDEAADLGSQMKQLFGIRPKVEESRFIKNRGYNFAVALHKFQQFWANQWRYFAEFTFLPEIYPGMRIELVDREPNPLSVYVEAVNHSGNRTTGFTTTVTFSTPTVFQDGRWTLLAPEIAPDSPLLPKDERIPVELSIAQQKAAMFDAGISDLDNSTGTNVTNVSGGKIPMPSDI